MKNLVSRIKKALLARKGESLIEAVASMLVLVILMATVSGMIQTSLRITGIALGEAQVMQENTINELVLGHYSISTVGNLEIVFDIAGGLFYDLIQEVEYNTAEDGIIAFSPR